MKARGDKVVLLLRSGWKRVAALGLLGAALAFVVFAAGVGVGGLVVYGWHKQNEPDRPPPRSPAAFSEVPAGTARQIAERFRPWLRFDSGERWRPLNIAYLLSERTGDGTAHAFCVRTLLGNDCVPVASEQDLTARVHEESSTGRASFVNLAGQAKDDYHAPGPHCLPLQDCGTGPNSAIYFHVIQSNDRYYVDYWWFFRYNNFYRSHPGESCRSGKAIAAGICDEHEGDWEGVTVVTPPDDAKTPDYVVYAAHKGTFRYSASELTLHDKTRPEVFVAQGSHASYPVACDGMGRSCDQPAALAAEGLYRLPEGRYDGDSPWERNDENCLRDEPSSCLLALPRVDRDPRGWTVWPGEWGAGCQTVCHGISGVHSPQSPGLQTRYQSPWCSTQYGNLVCDGRSIACRDRLGPLVAVVACSQRALAHALTSSTETPTGTLEVHVASCDSSSESVPGVVQVLCAPLRPGNTVAVSGGTTASQVLLRAQLNHRLYEARFDKLNLGAGRRVTFTIARSAADDRHVIIARVAGKLTRLATELRIANLRPAAKLLSSAGRPRR